MVVPDMQPYMDRLVVVFRSVVGGTLQEHVEHLRVVFWILESPLCNEEEMIFCSKISRVPWTSDQGRDLVLA